MSVSQHHHHAHSEFYEFLDSYHGQLNHNGYLFVPKIYYQQTQTSYSGNSIYEKGASIGWPGGTLTLKQWKLMLNVGLYIFAVCMYRLMWILHWIYAH